MDALFSQHRGDFAGVHMVPTESSDVPDEQEARLVVLGPEYPHSGKDASAYGPPEVAHQFGLSDAELDEMEDRRTGR